VEKKEPRGEKSGGSADNSNNKGRLPPFSSVASSVWPQKPNQGLAGGFCGGAAFKSLSTSVWFPLQLGLGRLIESGNGLLRVVAPKKSWLVVGRSPAPLLSFLSDLERLTETVCHHRPHHAGHAAGGDRPAGDRQSPAWEKAPYRLIVSSASLSTGRLHCRDRPACLDE